MSVAPGAVAVATIQPRPPAAASLRSIFKGFRTRSTSLLFFIRFGFDTSVWPSSRGLIASATEQMNRKVSAWRHHACVIHHTNCRTSNPFSTFHNPCDSYNFARPAFNETTPVSAARWLPSSARHIHARPSLRNHDPLPTAHTLTISISLPAGSLQRAATNEKNFGDEENSLTSKNSRMLAHTHHHYYKHI